MMVVGFDLSCVVDLPYIHVIDLAIHVSQGGVRLKSFGLFMFGKLFVKQGKDKGQKGNDRKGTATTTRRRTT